MTDSAHIAAGLHELFKHRRGFLVVGLTGRTGSGCSTVADAFGAQEYRALKVAAVHTPPRNHEDRKERIIQQWLDKHWRPFIKIQVSQVIAGLAFREALPDLKRFTSSVNRSLDLQPIADELITLNAQAAAQEEVIANAAAATREQRESAYKFYYSAIPAAAQKFRAHITQSVGLSEYTKIFQALGDNLRRSGSVLSTDINPARLMTLPQRIEALITLGRLHHRDVGEEQSYFVIDALRNPFEIRYLRERIAPFYVFAVRADANDRRERLQYLDMTTKQIDQLDKKEYPERKSQLNSYAGFISQDIQACLEIADVYVSNPGRPAHKDLTPMHAQIARYLALMQHPGLITPTNIERCMQAAFAAKANSGCISRQVGAVVTNAEYSILAVGWNDAPRGQVPCLLRNVNDVLTQNGGWDPAAYSNFETSNEPFQKHLAKSRLGAIRVLHVDGHNLSYCFKSQYNALLGSDNQVHTRSLHAEENAFLQLARHGGQGIIGGALFSTASPCVLCAKKAYQLGVKHIYYIDPYPDISQDHVLGVGNDPPRLELFYGAIGRAYHDLYEPLMSYKDELSALVVPALPDIPRQPMLAGISSDDEPL
jgi:deoxycytidylate deaminase